MFYLFPFLFVVFFKSYIHVPSASPEGPGPALLVSGSNKYLSSVPGPAMKYTVAVEALRLIYGRRRLVTIQNLPINEHA